MNIYDQMHQEDTKKILKIILFIVFLGVIFVLFCYIETKSEASQAILYKESLKEWKETQNGVRYFTTCAEGHLFIGTRSTHDYMQLAGPIGKCTTIDNKREH